MSGDSMNYVCPYCKNPRGFFKRTGLVECVVTGHFNSDFVWLTGDSEIKGMTYFVFTITCTTCLKEFGIQDLIKTSETR